MNQAPRKSRGIYVVTEAGCMNPTSGAWRHIFIGIDELSKYFEIEPILPAQVDENTGRSTEIRRGRRKNGGIRRSSIAGALRDLKHLLKRSIDAFKFLKKIRQNPPAFVYYRATFLDPLPLLLRMYGIPCFIEANGLQFESYKKYYPSILNPGSKLFERFIYSSASHVFFIGSYGAYWKLCKPNWCNVENGVAGEFLAQFSRPKQVSSKSLKICFVGHLMKHHSPALLVETMKKLAKKIDVEFHLIGANLKALAADLDDFLPVICHGFLSRDQLASTLGGMDVGIIPGGPEFASQMKLFDYGSARLAVVAPDLYNLRSWFPYEIAFFEPENSDSFFHVLNDLAHDRDRIAMFGNRLHERIKDEFTWEAVFFQQAKIMKHFLANKSWTQLSI